MDTVTAYSLFLDDERHPRHLPPFGAEWLICRSVQEAQSAIAERGVPACISFDHDLGENLPTGHDLAKWLVENSMDGKLDLSHFTFLVHSANPVGSENIIGLLDPYLRHLTREANLVASSSSGLGMP